MTETRVRSRSHAALVAVTQELQRRAHLLDSTDDVVSLSLTLKFTAGSSAVQKVVYNEERLARIDRPGR